MTRSSDFCVTLLGTGVPTPRPDRFGPSTLVEVGDQKLLIDAGRGAAIRLYQIGVPLGRIDALLLTHYHSDHTSGGAGAIGGHPSRFPSPMTRVRAAWTRLAAMSLNPSRIL
jgi:glyoxylase-like metal-dependent hydrolase (beta-lactamase superfamily II)